MLNFWVAALLLRVFLAAIPGGNPFDQSCFKAWGVEMLRSGPALFYAHCHQTIVCDYPPLYVYALGAWAWLYHLFDPTLLGLGKTQLLAMSPPMNFWFKLPGAFADLVNGWLIMRLLTPWVGEEKARFGAKLYLFNPLFLYDSVYWGQIDTLLGTFMLLACWALWQGRLIKAASLGALGVLLKPQGLFLLPFALSTQWYRRHGLRWIVALATGFLVAFIVLRPFWPGGSLLSTFTRFYTLMTRTAAGYPYNSMLAFSAPSLFGMKLDDGLLVLGLPLRVLSLIVLGLVQAGFAIALYQRRDPRSFYLGAALSVGACFLFATRMHERYVIPALILMTIVAVLDPRIKRLYWVLCVTDILNLIYAQDPHVTAFFDSFGMYRLFVSINLASFALLTWKLFRDPEVAAAEENQAEGRQVCSV